MTLPERFRDECAQEIAAQGANPELLASTRAWMAAANAGKYPYHFEWLGRPIIQYPQDMVVVQELIWRIQPDLIIETGIAHGGSLILSASMLALLDYCEAAKNGGVLDLRSTRRRVIGVDIDIRPKNRDAIEAHPMSHRIDMIQGSSVAPEVVTRVHDLARGHERVLVFLDSNHTHQHVLDELEAYAPLTTPGSYCCVFDTIIEDLSPDAFPDRPWGKGNNPRTAVREYLRLIEAQGRPGSDGAALYFEVDESIDHKLLITVAPGGYLRRVGRDS